MSGSEKSEMEKRWSAGITGTKIRDIIYLTEINSSNIYAKELLENPETRSRLPLLILAERQSAGRGRGGHSWWSPEGAILLSLVADWSDFGLTRAEPVEMSLRAANALAGTMNELLTKKGKKDEKPVPAAVVKPPNDVYVAGKKIAGILIESPTPDRVIVGIGINANNRAADAPEPLRSTAVSLTELTGERIDLIATVRRLIERLL